jgi:hypothetical protein
MTTLSINPLTVKPGQIVRLENSELTILSVPVLVGEFGHGIQRWACDALNTVGGKVSKIRLEMAH